MKAASRNFHVPLPAEVHAALRGEAERTGRAATSLAHEATEAFLERRRKQALHEAIAAYTAGYAGTEHDLDPVLERAAVERFVDDEGAG